MRILSVFGTRPEAIKMAPVILSLRKEPEIESILCVTGQHREMLDQALEIFRIKPDIDLNLMTPNQNLASITSKILIAVTKVLKEVKPDFVLVHGDTTTAMATSLSAFYENIKVGHIEAGLRTFDLNSPFPEEFNRQFVGKIANLHFAPTLRNKKSLIDEGAKSNSVVVTGNTVIDSLLWVLNKIDSSLSKKQAVLAKLNAELNFNFQRDRFILITAHRRENVGKGITSICKTIKALAKGFPEIKFIFPLHLNPKFKTIILHNLNDEKNVHLTNPLDYEQFAFLLRSCFLVLTDSGGIQEEAPSLGKPVLVMRNKTERPEALDAGTVKLVGTDQNLIKKVFYELINDGKAYQYMTNTTNPYGDGNASLRITRALIATWESSKR